MFGFAKFTPTYVVDFIKASSLDGACGIQGFVASIARITLQLHTG
jgi:hypothetical protein